MREGRGPPARAYTDVGSIALFSPKLQSCDSNCYLDFRSNLSWGEWTGSLEFFFFFVPLGCTTALTPEQSSGGDNCKPSKQQGGNVDRNIYL